MRAVIQKVLSVWGKAELEDDDPDSSRSDSDKAVDVFCALIGNLERIMFSGPVMGAELTNSAGYLYPGREIIRLVRV